MSDEKTTLEIIAPSVEEAVEKGLDQLGLPRDAVEVEVLDPGSRGIFGLGGRQARVRLTIGHSSPARVEPIVEKIVSEPVATVATPAAPAKPNGQKSPDEEALQAATTVVRDILERIRVRATVVSSIERPEDPKEQSTIHVEIRGDDLSILIGRHSETLNALQYITNLIVGKELGRWVPLSIDVQGYRERRERQLRQMARRTAEQVVQSGRKLSLEPMPPNERRLIHLELRDHPDVTTESVGDEPNRKVTIFLKKTA